MVTPMTLFTTELFITQPWNPNFWRIRSIDYPQTVIGFPRAQSPGNSDHHQKYPLDGLGMVLIEFDGSVANQFLKTATAVGRSCWQASSLLWG